jgi:hypothetical protein
VSPPELTHIIRAKPPWRRDGDLTECGRDPLTYRSISREEFDRRYSQLGQQRMALMSCMTCYETATRHATWERNPVACLLRDAGDMRIYHTSHPRLIALRNELVAIAALIAAHRAEFDELLEGLTQAPRLDERRRRRRR